MSGAYSDLINPDKALIFRITHRDNVSWILANGLHARSGGLTDPNFHPIGNRELIKKRGDHPVSAGPSGTLSDYVPFYFTPFSMMLLNIKTGYNGVPQVPNEEIVVIVSSLRKLAAMDINFVFYDQHAILATSQPYTHLDSLDKIDWPILQNRDFKRDNNEIGKTDRYQAEALVWKHLPVEGILGICCFTEALRDGLKSKAMELGLALPIFKRSEWYF